MTPSWCGPYLLVSILSAPPMVGSVQAMRQYLRRVWMCKDDYVCMLRNEWRHLSPKNNMSEHHADGLCKENSGYFPAPCNQNHGRWQTMIGSLVLSRYGSPVVCVHAILFHPLSHMSSHGLVLSVLALLRCPLYTYKRRQQMFLHRSHLHSEAWSRLECEMNTKFYEVWDYMPPVSMICKTTSKPWHAPSIASLNKSTRRVLLQYNRALNKKNTSSHRPLAHRCMLKYLYANTPQD